jgi:hypothetical protein
MNDFLRLAGQASYNKSDEVQGYKWTNQGATATYINAYSLRLIMRFSHCFEYRYREHFCFLF